MVYLKTTVCSFINPFTSPFSKHILGRHARLWPLEPQRWQVDLKGLQPHEWGTPSHDYSPVVCTVTQGAVRVEEKYSICLGWRQQGRLRKGSDIWTTSWWLRGVWREVKMCVWWDRTGVRRLLAECAQMQEWACGPFHGRQLWGSGAWSSQAVLKPLAGQADAKHPNGLRYTGTHWQLLAGDM